MISVKAIGLPALLSIAVGVGSLSPLTREPAEAQEQGSRQQSFQQNSPLKLIDPQDTIFLFLDHQTGLFQSVLDIEIHELRTNTLVLAKLATLAKIPAITTASEPKGPNGPLMTELAEVLPNATHVPRKGEISAWDNPDFVKTVKDTGRKTLVMCGVWTSVCVAFPAIQARAEGYTVYAVMDASGDESVMASQVTLARLTQAGIIPVTTNVMVCEVQRTWNRPEAAQYGALYAEFSPNFRAVIESFQSAQRQEKVKPAK